MNVLFRAIAGLVVLLVGAWPIYWFGAGYFGVVYLPTPLNVVAMVVLGVGLLRLVLRILRGDPESRVARRTV